MPSASSCFPPETRFLVLAAAAEPLGLEIAATGSAIDAQLLKLGARVEFAHPPAAYRLATTEERRRVRLCVRPFVRTRRSAARNHVLDPADLQVFSSGPSRDRTYDLGIKSRV